jgi:glycosyltransferase involved in cell wall biosynthesis
MSEKVAVVIPALNAEKTIEPVIRAALEKVKTVVVVNDGSSDRTGEVAARAGATVLRHPVNRGKGGALKTGFAWALEHGFDAVITLDADGQHLPSEIPKFIEARAATGADLIIGGRAHLFAEMQPRRRRANQFSAWIIGKVSRTGVTDSQSGFRYYSSRLLRALPFRAEGYALESEVIVRAGWARMPVINIPIELGFVDGLSTSHYRPVLDTIRIAVVVFRTRFFG